MKALTAFLRAPGVADITVTPEWTQAAPDVDITVLAENYMAATALADGLNNVEYTQTREPAGDPGTEADYYDWRGWCDGLRVRVTWNERVSGGER